VHSVRLPSFIVSTEVVFAAEGERLTIRHDAGETPAPYVAGTLLAIPRGAGSRRTHPGAGSPARVAPRYGARTSSQLLEPVPWPRFSSFTT
jgi:hypothetical protein